MRRLLINSAATGRPDTVALKGAQNLVKYWCSKGTDNKVSLRFEIDRGTCTHVSEATRAVSGATGFTLSRFGGQAPPVGCVIEDAPWSNQTTPALARAGQRMSLTL